MFYVDGHPASISIGAAHIALSEIGEYTSHWSFDYVSLHDAGKFYARARKEIRENPHPEMTELVDNVTNLRDAIRTAADDVKRRWHHKNP